MLSNINLLKNAKFVIYGGQGQLGLEFSEILRRNAIDFRSYDIEDLDISNIDSAREPLLSFKPDFILNCAAFNQVDKAEADYEAAYAVNAMGAKNIAELSQSYKCKAVHFSTDYVFAGDKNKPYIETETAEPINNYGKTKLEGEKLFDEYSENNLMFRLSWVYGKGQQNFIRKFLEWTKNQLELNISDDEISVPTSTRFAAEWTLTALLNDMSGMYHLVPQGLASRYDWAVEITRLIEMRRKLHKVSIETFNLPAKRPKFSAMSSKLIEGQLSASFPFWQEELERYMKV